MNILDLEVLKTTYVGYLPCLFDILCVLMQWTLQIVLDAKLFKTRLTHFSSDFDLTIWEVW